MKHTKFSFLVIKKTVKQVPCTACEGSGKKKRSFRKMNYIYDCPACKGTGSVDKISSEYVDLVDALKSINNT